MSVPMKPDGAYPWAGRPRTFMAAAMPQGDRAAGVAGPLVFISERRAGAQDRPRYLTPDEARALRDEIDGALRAFDLARDLAEAVAYRGPWPIKSHRTLEQMMAEEAREEA